MEANVVQNEACLYHLNIERPTNTKTFLHGLTAKYNRLHAEDKNDTMAAVIYNSIYIYEKYQETVDPIILAESYARCENLYEQLNNRFGKEFLYGFKCIIETSKKCANHTFKEEGKTSKNRESIKIKKGSVYDIERNKPHEKEELTCTLLYKDLNAKSKGAVKALLAGVLIEYKSTNSSRAVKFALKAVKFNGGNAEINYQAGKCLSRTRNHENKFQNVENEEIEYLKAACESDKENVLYQVEYTWSLRERAHNHNRQMMWSNKQAALVLRDIPEKEYSPYICIRLAKLFMVHQPYRYYEKAKFYLDLCLEKSQDIIVYRVAGQYYAEFEKNHKKALQYYENTYESGDYKGSLCYNNMELIMSKNYDPTPFYNTMIEKFKEPPRQIELRVLKGFHFIISNNLNKAVDVLVEAMELERKWKLNWPSLQAFNLIYRNAHFKDLNIYIMLYDDLKSALNNRQDPEHVHKLQGAYKKLEEKYPEFIKGQMNLGWRKLNEDLISKCQFQEKYSSTERSSTKSGQQNQSLTHILYPDSRRRSSALVYRHDQRNHR